jgi:hypothetical protein
MLYLTFIWSYLLMQYIWAAVASLGSCPRNNIYFAGSQLAVFQGATALLVGYVPPHFHAAPESESTRIIRKWSGNSPQRGNKFTQNYGSNECYTFLTNRFVIRRNPFDSIYPDSLKRACAEYRIDEARKEVGSIDSRDSGQISLSTLQWAAWRCSE